MDLKNEDCLETFKAIPNESIDLIVTDPPYKITSRGGRLLERRKSKKRNYI